MVTNNKYYARIVLFETRTLCLNKGVLNTNSMDKKCSSIQHRPMLKYEGTQALILLPSSAQAQSQAKLG